MFEHHQHKCLRTNIRWQDGKGVTMVMAFYIRAVGEKLRLPTTPIISILSSELYHHGVFKTMKRVGQEQTAMQSESLPCNWRNYSGRMQEI